MTEVACIGECMIELTQGAGNQLTQGFGGDTLNTAVYLARLGMQVDYITALGDDPFSDELMTAWQGEGVGTARVLRIAGKMPGLYAIRTNAVGERSFYYWRDSAAARALLDQPETDALLDGLKEYSLIYLSGITLSLFSDDGRDRLITGLTKARANGSRIAFDTNFRTRGWPMLDVARHAYQAMLDISDVVLASTEDLVPLYGERPHVELLDLLRADEVILKLPEPACVVRSSGVDRTVKAGPVARVVDTTAAGDSFSAAYLAARLRGLSSPEAAEAGHRLAGVVVGHRGAIIPRSEMPSGLNTMATEH
ncbi:sugar kinase [Bradyrhizobium sp. SYSU BS000235]|uniref:sugar kinase n=1 Tax=Bradyrhizobium sp. SYSU BS000235 TaxID=3411332 RepID=UPI003C749894